MRSAHTLLLASTLAVALGCGAPDAPAGPGGETPGDEPALAAVGEVCSTHYDCEQGEFCYRGACSEDSESPVYHCGKDGCPPGKWCVTASGARSTCAEDRDFACQDACDCGPAHACLDVPGLGRRCVADEDDPWKTDLTNIFDVTIPDGEPTYCCAASECFAGSAASDRAGSEAEFACYDDEAMEARSVCGGAACLSAAECEAGESCVDAGRGTDAVPRKICSETGRCVSNALAESVFGYRSSDILPGCTAGSGKSCVLGWEFGGTARYVEVTGTPGTCGDGTCGPLEYPDTCPADCSCGDGVCSPSELSTCAADCAPCGDGTCDPWETPKTCPADCPTVSCGDGSCDLSEVATCSEDCLCEAAADASDLFAVCGDEFCDDGERGLCEADCGDAPLAEAGGPYAGEEGEAIAFDGAGSRDPDFDALEFDWDFGDGAAGTGERPIHAYADEGTGPYTVSLTVTDSDGKSDTDETIATIANVAPTVDAGPDVGLVSGETLAATVTFSDPGIEDDPWTVTIDWGDGFRSTSIPIADQSVPFETEHRYCGTGSLTLTAAVTDEDGGRGADDRTVTVSPVALSVDVRPGSPVNPITPSARSLPVAVLTTAGVDATRLDATTATLGDGAAPDTPVRTRPNGTPLASEEDADGDGNPDLVLHFDLRELAETGELDPSTERLVLTAAFLDGCRVGRGSDAVTVR